MLLVRAIPVFLIAAGVLAGAAPLRAQVHREARPSAKSETFDLASARRLMRPLELDVEALQVEVKRLQAALASLQITI